MGLDINTLHRDIAAFDIVNGGKALQLLISTRYGCDQGFGIFMLWCAEDLGHLARFHHLTAIHNRHTVRNIGNHTDVMGDDDHPQGTLAAELLDQVQDLRLDRHIKCGCRLIRDY